MHSRVDWKATVSRAVMDKIHQYRRYDVALILGVTLFFSLPLLFSPLDRDDFIHKALLESGASLWTLLDSFFRFVGNAGFTVPELRQSGLLPWWSDDQLTIQFWRPLSTLTHWLDYQLWPQAPWLMHLHNVLWYLAGLWVLARIYHSTGLPQAAAALALILFALDMGHVAPVMWIANRNLLLAFFFALLALWSLQRWADAGKRTGLIGFIVAFLAALLSAEAGVSLLAFVGAYLLTLDRRAWRWRIATGLLALGLFVGWHVVYVQMGFGASHNGMYLDPLRSPDAFLRVFLTHGPIMMLDQVLGIESFISFQAPAFKLKYAAVCVLLMAALVALWWPLLSASRAARFWLLAALIAMIPATTMTISSGRMMFFSGAGLMAVFALHAHGVFTQAAWMPRSISWYPRLAKSVIVSVLVLQVLSAVGGWLLYGAQAVQSALRGPDPDAVSGAINRFTAPLMLAEAEGRSVIIVNAPSAFVFFYRESYSAGLDLPALNGVFALTPASVPVQIQRTGPQTLRVMTSDYFPMALAAPIPAATKAFSSAFISHAADAVAVAPTAQFNPGYIVDTNAFTATILETGDYGQPRVIEFVFKHALNADEYLWLSWDWEAQHYQRWAVPPSAGVVNLSGPF